MLKKKKLQLATTTLRALTNSQLAQAAGGSYGSDRISCSLSCNTCRQEPTENGTCYTDTCTVELC